MAVAFSAAASLDTDGAIASYSWNFGDGGTGTGATPSHVYTTGGTYTATLTVSDNRGATASASRTVTVATGPAPTSVTVSGRVTFERVPFSAALGRGLAFTAIIESPAREVEVELLAAGSGAVLATAATDTGGYYSLTTTPNTDVFVRAKVMSRFTGTSARPASWDLRVRNNTNGDALYVLDGGSSNTLRHQPDEQSRGRHGLGRRFRRRVLGRAGRSAVRGARYAVCRDAVRHHAG